MDPCANPLQDLITFWLNEFSEADSDEDVELQVAGCIATFANFPGIWDAEEFTEFLRDLSADLPDEWEPAEDESDPETPEARVGTGQDNNPSGKNGHARKPRKSKGKRPRKARKPRAKRSQEQRSAEPKIERRTVEFTEFRLAPAGADGKRHMVGHAAVFNSLSQDLGGFREEVRSGAFADAVAHDDVRALFNHDPNFVLGRNTAGTLKLAEDSRGLSIDIDPPDTQWARDLAVSIERGDINQMSFAFQTIKDSWAHDARGTVRSLIEVRLLDVSPVTYPAYLSADIALRSALRKNTPPAVDQAVPSVEDERRLRLKRKRLDLIAAD